MDNIIIEPRPVPIDERSTIYKFPEYEAIVTVSPIMQDLIERLREMPAPIRLRILCLSEKDIQDFMNNEKEKLEQKLYSALLKKYRYRDTGEAVNMADFFRYEFKVDYVKMKNKLKKGRLTIEELQAYTKPFEEEKDIFSK